MRIAFIKRTLALLSLAIASTCLPVIPASASTAAQLQSIATLHANYVSTMRSAAAELPGIIAQNNLDSAIAESVTARAEFDSAIADSITAQAIFDAAEISLIAAGNAGIAAEDAASAADSDLVSANANALAAHAVALSAATEAATAQETADSALAAIDNARASAITAGNAKTTAQTESSDAASAAAGAAAAAMSFPADAGLQAAATTATSNAMTASMNAMMAGIAADTADTAVLTAQTAATTAQTLATTAQTAADSAESADTSAQAALTVAMNALDAANASLDSAIEVYDAQTAARLLAHTNLEIAIGAATTAYSALENAQGLVLLAQAIFDALSSDDIDFANTARSAILVAQSEADIAQTAADAALAAEVAALAAVTNNAEAIAARERAAREAAINLARQNIVINLASKKSITTSELMGAGLLAKEIKDMNGLNAALGALTTAQKSDLDAIALLVAKFAAVDKIASKSSITAQDLVSVGLIDPRSKSKSLIMRELKALSADKIDTFEEIQKVIATVEARAAARKKSIMDIAARISAKRAA